MSKQPKIETRAVASTKINAYPGLTTVHLEGVCGHVKLKLGDYSDGTSFTEESFQEFIDGCQSFLNHVRSLPPRTTVDL